MLQKRLSLASPSGYFFVLSSLAIIAGFVLSIISWMQICTEQCGEAHNYRICGFQFETFGLTFFPALAAFHFLSVPYRTFGYVAGLLLASACGAEIMFILLQKYTICHWCPICLSIAGTVGLASLAYLLDYSFELKSLMNEGKRSEIMRFIRRGVAPIIVVIFGFLFAYFGVAKVNKLQAIENSIKEAIAFGNKSSPIDIYLFSDWECPACRQLEPNLVKMAPEIMKKARLTFVDFTIHPETLNFTPYNLAFMVNNKSQYLQLRDALTKISEKTGTPSDKDVEEAIAPLGIKYKQLNYSDVALGMKYFKHLGKEFEINSTPTMVIVNRSAKKGKKLYGPSEITESNVTKAIKVLME